MIDYQTMLKAVTLDKEIFHLTRVIRHQELFLDSVTTMYLRKQENVYFTNDDEYYILQLDLKEQLKKDNEELVKLRELKG